MTYKEKNREINNLLQDIEEMIEKLENQIRRPTGDFEKEKVTDIINQLLKAYALKGAILTSNNICFFTNS